MDTCEIEMCLKMIDPDLEFNVFAANRLPVNVSLPMYLISNLDPDTKPGSHWVAIYINSRGVGEYFDSFGRKPISYHEEFLKRNCKHYIYNGVEIQNCLTSVCGMYSLVYIYCRFNGMSMHNFVNKFSNNTLCNDYILKNIFVRLFSNK